MKRYFIIIPFILLLQTLSAQQDLFFTQQQFSRGNINPAGIGNTGDVDLFLFGRLQWLGVDNAPHTIVFNATNYLPKIQSGIGLTVSYDALGVGHHTTEIKAEYSYQLDIHEKWILSMGLSAGVYSGSYNPSVNTLGEETEREKLNLSNEKKTETTPDFNLGLELNSMNWTMGVSCTHIQNNASTSYAADRHFYGYVMRSIQLDSQWDLLASIAYMNRNKVHLSDIGLLLFYHRLIWGGFSWRPDLANGCNPSYLSCMVGFEYQRIRFGYVYECGLGSNSTLPSNTHEIVLSFRIPKKREIK